MRVKDKVAIITGGGTGVGKHLAFAFAKEGAKLALAARTLPRLQEVVDQVNAQGGEAIAVATDITKEDQVKALVDATLRRYGRIDLLINNAAYLGVVARVDQTKVSDWWEVIGINVTGAFLCSREVLKHMIPRRSGSILNVSSLSGKRGAPMRACYVATKHALHGLTHTLALEVGKYNIRVNALVGSTLPTEAIRESFRQRAAITGKSIEEQEAIYAASSPMKRFVTLEEFAEAALFMASDASSSLTGQAVIAAAGAEMR